LDDLAQGQMRLAPGMHEIARGEASLPTPLPTASHDTCVRVVFASAGAAAVALVTVDGDVLAKAKPTEHGTLGERGPVCFHADQAPRIVVDGDAGIVRYVVWGVP
jgi:hypothetical protein